MRLRRTAMKPDRISRRTFLGRSAAAAAVATSPLWEPLRSVYADGSHPGNPVRIPPEWHGGRLTAAPADIEVWPGHRVPLLAINGSVPAPTIRVQRGHFFEARVKNDLMDEDFVLHWHGILAPSEMDGHPRDAVGPGQGYRVNYPVFQRAGTYWYHSHVDMMTAEQIYLGLAAVFLVAEP